MMESVEVPTLRSYETKPFHFCVCSCLALAITTSLREDAIIVGSSTASNPSTKLMFGS